MDGLKNWYVSKTIWGGAVAILASCATLVGLDLDAADQMELTDRLVALAGAVGGIVAIYGRIAADKRLR